MDYDDLLARLSNYAPSGSYDAERAESWRAITALQARVAELEAQNEQLQVQLAGCGVAALQNTRTSIAEHRIGRDAYGHSASYEEVCSAVDREIEWRERAERAEAELAAARADAAAVRAERDAYRDAMARMNAPTIAMAALQPPPPIIMPAMDWELHQQIQTLNERIAYLEPILIAARNLVDNAEEYECDGLGLFAQHGWWEPLHDALDPDGSEAADDIRQPIATAK